MERKIKISKDKYYKAMIKVINCFLNLTEYEVELISNMFVYNIKVLDKNTRLVLRQALGTSEQSFNNYVKRLKDKNVLIDTSHGLGLNPTIQNAVSDKKVIIEFDVLQDVSTESKT